MNERPTPETDEACDEVYAQGVAHIPLVGFMKKLERERDEAREEGLEQARLLGVSGEREAKLITQRDESLRLLEKWEQVAIGGGTRVLELTKQRDKLAQTLQSLQVACFRIGRGDVNDVGIAVEKMRQKALEALTDLEGGKQ